MKKKKGKKKSVALCAKVRTKREGDGNAWDH